MELENNPYLLITVERYYHPIEAHIAAGLLKSEGIPVFLHGINHVSVDWLITNAIGGIRLQVPHKFEAQAKEILSVDAKLDESYLKTLEKCPKCKSSDISSHTFLWKLSFLVVHLFQIPIPWDKEQRICKSCCHKWSLNK